MILFYNEKSKDAVISVNSSTAQRPVSNVIDSRLTRVFRTVAAITTANIVFDMTAAVAVDCVAIAAHNITSGATIKLQGNATDVWTSPSVDETLSHDSDIITKVITSATYRYWRISIVDAANPDGYIQIGRAWIGESFDTPGIAPTVSVGDISSSVKSKSIGGQTYTDIRPKKHDFGVSIPSITYANRATFEDVLDTVDIGIPFFVDFDETNSDLDVYYVTISGDGFTFTNLINPLYYTLSIDLDEEV